MSRPKVIRGKALGVFVAAVLVVIAGFGVLVLSGRADGSSPLTEGSIAVLREPSSPGDSLPDIASRSGLRDQYIASSARHAQTVGGHELFVAAGKTDGVVCLIVSGTAELMTNCGSVDALSNGALYLVRPNGDGTMDAWGVVADGVQRVEGAVVRGNTFSYSGRERRELAISTAAETRPLDLGPLHPPKP